MQRDDTTLEITELPVRKWTQDYKEFLESLIKPEDKNASALLEVCFHLRLFHSCKSGLHNVSLIMLYLKTSVAPGL